MDCSCGNNPKDEEMNSILEKYSKDKSNLIQILNEVQENYGYIPKYSQISISEYLDIPLAEIYGVITFYARFTLKPKGKYNIAVCLGTACFVKGSEKVLDKAKEILKIDVGETTEDGKFSLEATRCIGACGLAPVFTVNEEVYGKATPELIKVRHKLVHDITNRLNTFSLNTVISGFMEYNNKLMELSKKGGVDKETLETYIILLAPFAPHVSEELWEQFGHTDSVFHATWPEYDEEAMKDDEIEIPVQINGKTKCTIAINPDGDKDEILAKAKEALGYKVNGTIRKEIYVPGRIVNLVIK